MALSDNQISVDLEGISDSPRTSILAIVALVLGILGAFAIVAPLFAFFCLASAICGLTVVGNARRSELSNASVYLAVFSIYGSLFCGLSGVAYRWTQDWILYSKANEVATNYMLALSKGDRSTAIRMTGLPQMVADAELAHEKKSREQEAVRNFLSDPAIQEVIKLGEAASWKSTGLKAKYRSGIMMDLSIGFVNEKSTNQRPIIVAVRMVPPTKHSTESRNQWYVESIHFVPL